MRDPATTLPNCIEAEKCVLGAILINDQHFDQCATLSAQSFYLHKHRIIFTSIARLKQHAEPVSLITVQYDLIETGELEAVDGPAYLAGLMDGIPDLANIGHYVVMIQEAAKKRTLIQFAERIKAECLDGSHEAADIAQRIQQAMAGLSERRTTVPAHWRWLDVAKRRDWNCVPLRWTIKDLIAQNTFVIVAASTQSGKTLLGLFLSMSMLHDGELFGKLVITPVDKILYLGLEDPDRRFDEHFADIEGAFPTVEEGRFIVHTAPGFSLTDDAMFAYLENLIQQHGFKVVFIDTYQKATPGLASFDDEKQAVILHRLANLTRKLNVTIIVLDHFRKPDKVKKNHRDADISDIKGTGAKAQNADCIILLERTPDRKQMKLQSFSKDSDVNVRFLLNISAKGSGEEKFTYAADLESLGSRAAETGMTNRQNVLDAMTPGEKLKLSVIADRTQLAESTVRTHLNALRRTKQVDACGNARARLYWRLVPESAEKSAEVKHAS